MTICPRIARAAGGVLACAWVMALCAAPAFAQVPLTVTPGFDGSAWIPRNTAIELKLSQPVTPGTGRIGVMIGVTDLSAAFAATPDGLRYRPALLPLPPGEAVVVVSLVSPAEVWTEIGRFPIRVLTTGGLEKSEIAPTIDANLHGQVAEGHDPESAAPPRATYQDLTVNAALQTTHVKGAWSVRFKANVIGVTNQPEALRYGALGTEAPHVDLADYLVQIDHGKSNVSIGSVVFGRNRLLLNGFRSRGLTGLLSFGKVSFALAAMNGTTIVGWTNPFGVSTSEHRVVGAELGFEAVPARPGALGVQLSLMEGSRTAQAGYTQGAVTDSEHSHGAGLHVAASDTVQRIRFDAGYSRSWFTNPNDTTVSQSGATVPAVETTRDARYADLAVDILKSLHVAANRPATLVVNYRYEQADPLYQSVGGVTRADFLQNTVDVSTSVGPVTGQVNLSAGGDNLDHVASLLTTLTHSTGGNVTVPLAALLKKPTAFWLPAVSYNIIQIHQFGEQIPVGFSASDVPDMASLNQNLLVQWTARIWHGGYRWNRSSQDNRQIGRELADFSNAVNAFSFGAMPRPSFDVSLDVALESAANLQLSQVTHTRRIGGTVNWRLTTTSVLAAGFSTTHSMDDPLTTDQTSNELRVEFSQRIDRRRSANDRPFAQLFLRYTHRTGNLIIPGLTIDNSQRTWTLTTGLTLRVF